MPSIWFLKKKRSTDTSRGWVWLLERQHFLWWRRFPWLYLSSDFYHLFYFFSLPPDLIFLFYACVCLPSQLSSVSFFIILIGVLWSNYRCSPWGWNLGIGHVCCLGSSENISAHTIYILFFILRIFLQSIVKSIFWK